MIEWDFSSIDNLLNQIQTNRQIIYINSNWDNLLYFAEIRSAKNTLKKKKEKQNNIQHPLWWRHVTWTLGNHFTSESPTTYENKEFL